MMTYRNTLFIIFAIVIVLGAFFIFKKQYIAISVSQNKTTTGTSTNISSGDGEYAELAFPDNTINTSDWQTYRNEQFGFEVKYPKGWDVTTHTKKELQEIDPTVTFSDSLVGTVGFDSGVPYFSMSFSVYNDPIGLKQAIEQEQKSHPGTPSPRGKNMQINEVRGRWFPNDNGDYYDYGIYFLGSARFGYRISHAISPKDSNISETRTFQKILLSFKLIQ